MFFHLLRILERDGEGKASASLETKAPESKTVVVLKDFSSGSQARDTGCPTGTQRFAIAMAAMLLLDLLLECNDYWHGAEMGPHEVMRAVLSLVGQGCYRWNPDRKDEVIIISSPCLAHTCSIFYHATMGLRNVCQLQEPWSGTSRHPGL